MLRMVRRRNKKCSETGPKRCYSDLEQYQYPFRYYLRMVNCTIRHLTLLTATDTEPHCGSVELRPLTKLSDDGLLQLILLRIMWSHR